MGFKVFVSHSIRDLTLVYQLKYFLEQNGIETYLAELDPKPGEPLGNKIAEAIQGSQCVLAILTADGVRSQWVNQEIGLAKAKNVPVVPVAEQGVSLPGVLQGTEYIPLDRANPDRAVVKAVDFLVKEKKDKEWKDNLTAGVLVFLGLWLLSRPQARS